MSEWRNLHNEKRNHFYSSPDIVKAISTRLAKHAAFNREMKVRMKYFRRPEAKSPNGRRKRRREDRFEMDMKKVGVRV